MGGQVAVRTAQPFPRREQGDMPKIAYTPKLFAARTQDLIAQCNQIINRYAAQGFDLTVRQLYYRLVATAVIPNQQREYKRLVRVISEARLAGLVDWQAITDRTRQIQHNTHWTDAKEITQAAHDSFMVDNWAGQECRPEVWVEKDALVGVIGQVCRRLDVPYFSCRGYSSLSAMWRAAGRLRRHLDVAQTPYVIHLADHDPSGIDMSRDIKDRMSIFGLSVRSADMDFKRLALNQDQIDLYQPPPNPIKMTDSRAGDYIVFHGYDSWELDALEPQVITDLIRDEILALRDQDVYDEMMEREDYQRDLLADAMTYMEERTELYDDGGEDEDAHGS